MAFELPRVDAASLEAWCRRYLGSPTDIELFRRGHLTSVIGTRLADGREVVVKVRPAALRIAACTEVQHRLFDSGYPCPRPLAGPAPLGEYEATAEAHVSGGAMQPDCGRCGWPAAAALAQLVHSAPPPEQVPSLAPRPAWTAWNHNQGGLWPRPDELDVDLNEVEGLGWIDSAARAARQRLLEGQDHAVIGHGDWITDNLRWDGNRLLVVYDWDSLVVDSEAVIAGLAAAIYLNPPPTVTETRDFLDAYVTARGRPFSHDELQRCWAAGVWTRAYDAKLEDAVGKSVTSLLTEDEAQERLRRAGMR